MKRFNTLLALLAMTGFLSLANAQQGDTQTAETDQQTGAQRQGDRVVIGQVQDTRDVQLQGVEQPHRLLKLSNQQGEMIIVDLGSMAKAGDRVSFEKGDRVIAIGRNARINDKPVLFARYAGVLYQTGNRGMAASQ